MDKVTYTIVLQQEPEGGFTVIVPALPGCVTYGKDLAEAKQMAQEAIAAYIESLKKHNDPVPVDDSAFVSSVTINQPVPSYA